MERIPFSRGERLAGALLGNLSESGVIKRGLIVGSIRRRCETVGDLEILVEPADGVSVCGWLTEGIAAWETLSPRMKEFPEAISLEWDEETKRRGERYCRLLYDGASVDVFICLPPASWGVLSVIRTGPADFSRYLVSPRSSDGGGAMPGSFRVQDGRIVKLRFDDQPDLFGNRSVRRWIESEVDTPDETAVFNLLGIPYVEPWERSLAWLKSVVKPFRWK